MFCSGTGSQFMTAVKLSAMLLQVAGNFHIAPGRSYSQQHVHGQLSAVSVMFVSFTVM